MKRIFYFIGCDLFSFFPFHFCRGLFVFWILLATHVNKNWERAFFGVGGRSSSTHALPSAFVYQDTSVLIVPTNQM